MGIEKFWNNVRGASAGVFRFDVFAADEPVPSHAEIESRLRADNRWFRPLAVQGFDKNEFVKYLQPDELTELEERVDAFKVAVAAGDMPGGVAAFSRILGVLNFYLYADPDGLRYGKRIVHRLMQIGWPETLRELRFWRATWDEEFPMLSIYANLRENRLKTVERYLEECRKLRPILDCVAIEVAPEWFPLITFRTDEVLAEYVEQPDEDDEVPAGSSFAPTALSGAA